MSGRADLRASAERLRARYPGLLTASDPRPPAGFELADRIEQARQRVTGRSPAPTAQLALDITPLREETT